MEKKKESRWRREQEHRKKDKSRRTIGGVLIAIFFILILGISWQAYGDFKKSTWDGQNRLNLVLKMKPISIISFDPHSQKISLLLIPDGTYIEAAGGYGPYRVEKIYPLGELEGRGISLLANSLETYFGLPIDGWIEAEESEREITNVKQTVSSLIIRGLKKKSFTNLSHWDLIRLWLMTNRLRSHKIEKVDLGETTVAEEFDLPDGSRAKRIDEQRISRIISLLFTDNRIRQEDLAIAIMNAGGETGLAAKAARLVTNIGGRLVEVGDWPEKLENCQIKATPKARKTYTCQKLLKVFGCQYETDLEKETRWDLLLFLTGEGW